MLASASPALARAIALYPNPSPTGVVALETAGLPSGSSLEVSVLNQLGQVVYRANAPANAPVVLDLGHLSAGLYHVRVECEGQYATRLVSITR